MNANVLLILEAFECGEGFFACEISSVLLPVLSLLPF